MELSAPRAEPGDTARGAGPGRNPGTLFPAGTIWQERTRTVPLRARSPRRKLRGFTAGFSSRTGRDPAGPREHFSACALWSGAGRRIAYLPRPVSSYYA